MTACGATAMLFAMAAETGPCLTAELHVAGRFSQSSPAEGLHRGFSLPQSRLVIGIGEGKTFARLGAVAARPAASSST